MKSGVRVILFFYLQGKGLEVDPSSQKGRALACIKGGVIVVHSEVNKKNLLYIFSLSLCVCERERERDCLYELVLSTMLILGIKLKLLDLVAFTY